MKMPNFTFCGGREHKKTTFFVFPKFDTVFKTSTTENFEAGRIHFLRDVFVAIAVFVAQAL